MAGTVFKEIAERVMASVQFLPVDLFSKVEKAKEEHKLLLDVSRKIDTVGKRHKRTMWPTITELSRIEADIISREMGMDVNADNKINSQWVKMEYNRMQNEVRYSEALEGKNTVPNVSGMGLKDAVYRLEDVGLKVKVGRKNGEKGQPYGKVIEQSIKAGEIIKQGETIKIYVKR